jgi:hypothetical protein
MLPDVAEPPVQLGHGAGLGAAILAAVAAVEDCRRYWVREYRPRVLRP